MPVFTTHKLYHLQNVCCDAWSMKSPTITGLISMAKASVFSTLGIWLSSKHFRIRCLSWSHIHGWKSSIWYSWFQWCIYMYDTLTFCIWKNTQEILITVNTFYNNFWVWVPETSKLCDNQAGCEYFPSAVLHYTVISSLSMHFEPAYLTGRCVLTPMKVMNFFWALNWDAYLDGCVLKQEVTE